MDEGATHLESVGSVVGALTDLGLSPVLVGGMALVVLGSRRVTRDFDLSSGVPATRSTAFWTSSTIAASSSLPESTPPET